MTSSHVRPTWPPIGALLPSRDARKCFGCHTTQTSARDEHGDRRGDVDPQRLLRALPRPGEGARGGRAAGRIGRGARAPVRSGPVHGREPADVVRDLPPSSVQGSARARSGPTIPTWPASSRSGSSRLVASARAGARSVASPATIPTRGPHPTARRTSRSASPATPAAARLVAATPDRAARPPPPRPSRDPRAPSRREAIASTATCRASTRASTSSSPTTGSASDARANRRCRFAGPRRISGSSTPPTLTYLDEERLVTDRGSFAKHACLGIAPRRDLLRRDRRWRVSVWNTEHDRPRGSSRHDPRRRRDVATCRAARPGQESFPDPNAPGTSARVFIDRDTFDQDDLRARPSPSRGRSGTPARWKRCARRSAVAAAAGIAALRDAIRPAPSRLARDGCSSVREAIRLEKSIAALYMHEGKFAEAASWLKRILEPSRGAEVSADLRAEVHVLLGIAALRRGEVENCLDCVGPSSCIFPIAREAFHVQQAGSREAIEQFTAYLEHAPGDLRVRWLLNIAYMTLGEYPEKVPPAYLIPLDRFRSKLDAGPVRERRAAGRPGCEGPEPGRREHLRRFQRRRPARPAHDLDRRRSGCLPVHQSRRRHVRGSFRRGRPRPAGLCAQRRPRRLRQRRQARRPAAAGRLGEVGPALAPAEQGGRRSSRT